MNSTPLWWCKNLTRITKKGSKVISHDPPDSCTWITLSLQMKAPKSFYIQVLGFILPPGKYFTSNLHIICLQNKQHNRDMAMPKLSKHKQA